jgi:cytochrome P450
MAADAPPNVVRLQLPAGSPARAEFDAQEMKTEPQAVSVDSDTYRGTPSLLGQLRDKVRLARDSFFYRVLCFLLSHHLPFKLTFAALRRARPIAVMRNLVIVTKAADVREVLDRFDDFTLNEVLGEGMPWGPFLMTVDWRVQHDQERQLLQSVVVPAADVELIRCVTARQCQIGIENAAKRCEERGRIDIDVVTELAVPTMVAVVDAYFGVPAVKADQGDLATIMADLASLIMARPPEGSQRQAEIRRSIVTVTRHLEDIVQTREQEFRDAPAQPRADDLITRLMYRLGGDGELPPWFDRNWIRRYITGLVGTGGFTVVRATTQAVDRLMAFPASLERARALGDKLDELERDARVLAVCKANRKATDDDRRRIEKAMEANSQRIEAMRSRLRQIVYEALRFRPMLPLLIRYSPRETIIAKGTRHARMVPAGARVCAPPLAAMFDPEVMEMPWRFCSSRPLDDFLHFGHGARACFGRYVADEAMLEIVRSLLRLPDLKRAAWPDGRIRYQGPVARSLALTFSKTT